MWFITIDSSGGPATIAAMISYRLGNDLDLDTVIEVYRDSGLGERRPIDDRPRMAKMLERANLVVSAWDGDRLVGISRSLSDYCYATYLSDLAVRADYQRQGIGRELIRRTQEASKPATILLFAAPDAVPYYPHIGFTEGSGWKLFAGQNLRTGGGAGGGTGGGTVGG